MKKNPTPFLFKRFIFIFLPMSMLIGFVYVAYLISIDQTKLQTLKTSEHLSMNYFGELIAQDFTQVELDLLSFAKLPSLVNYSSDSEQQNVIQTAGYFKDLAALKRKYDQIRYIDLAGMELIRIDYNKGEPSIVDEIGLQNKAERYYFEETIKLKPNEIYISSLDLNIENGEIEQPLKPVIRFATPVFDAVGQKKGIVVINYLAENLRATFMAHQAEMSLGKSYLIDAAGNILFSKDYSLGRALKNIKDARSENIIQKLTEQVRETSNNEDQVDEIAMLEGQYLSVSLFGNDLVNNKQNINMSNDTTPSKRALLGQNFDWKMIVFISSAQLRQLSTLFSNRGIVQGLLLVLMTAIVSFFIAQLGYQRQREQFEKTNSAIERQHEVETLLETIPSGIIICDTHGVILQINNEVERLFGYHIDELVGQSIDILVPAANRHAHTLKRREFTKSEQLARYNIGQDKLFGLSKDGAHIPVSISVRKITTRSSIKIVASVVDISEQMARQIELEQASDKAQSANKAKSLFLSTMSHEIRTPLNAIIGMLYLHQSTDLNFEQKNQVKNLKLASDKLLMLINDILDFSKIEAGEMKLEKSPFILSSLIQGLSNIFKYQAETKDNFLKIPAVNPSDFPVLIGDSTRLGQILSNLLSNGCKFTNKGTVGLKVEQIASSQDDKICLRFEVSDTGIGMNEQTQAGLFNAFSQADTSINRKYSGTGLGLSIVKRLTQMMGGKVKVTSELGRGSTFSIEIPFDYTSEAINELSSTDINRPLRVLIADDEEIDRAVLMRQAEQLGWMSETVSNGQDLIDKVVMCEQQANPIDCIIVDWKMPALDGLKAIEELSYRVQHMPSVIMVTAHDKLALMDNIKDIKPDSILTKPVKASYLFNCVNEAVIKHGILPEDVIKRTTLADIDVLWLDGMRVLVVDDSEMNLEICHNILEKHGAIVTTSTSGLSAIAMLEKDNDKFDVILMDIQMPEMDGLETTQIIRHRLALTLPIIALSAGVTIEEKQSVANAGMDGFLPKPMEPERILKTLIQQVNKFRQLAQNETLPSAKFDSFTAKNKWPNFVGIDSKNAKKTSGDDLVFYTKMLKLYLKQQITLCDELDKAIADNDLELIKGKMHKLKGQAANLGFLSTANAANAVEIAIINSPDEVSTPYGVFRDIHNQLISDINDYLLSL